MSEINIKKLIDDGYVIVLDANVILNIYRYTPEFSDFALKCLKETKNRIVLPGTVRLEYEKHYRGEFSKMEMRTKEVSNETKKQIEKARAKILDSCYGLERLQFQDVDDLKRSLSEKLDAVKSTLENYFVDHAALELIQHSWAGVDYLRKFILEVDENSQVMESPTQEDLYRWCEEGEKRYKRKDPPGFKDAKNKDGVRKYSDLILWQETIRYAKSKATNVIFVTDDGKADWWETIDESKVFHHKLFEEFRKTNQSIVPMTAQMFFAAVSDAYEIEKTDVVEIALQMTDEKYCEEIEASVFDSIEEELMYNAIDYIDEETANIGSEGIDEFEITVHEFVHADRIDRDENTVIYEFEYNVTGEGVSYEYWGRDDDTKEIILSDGRNHVFEGQIIVRVEREAEVFLDFEKDNSFETAEIIRGKLLETSFEDLPEPPGELGYCPRCGSPLTIENDGGTGFCYKCSLEQE